MEERALRGQDLPVAGVRLLWLRSAIIVMMVSLCCEVDLIGL
jgi:hypothetical protein